MAISLANKRRAFLIYRWTYLSEPAAKYNSYLTHSCCVPIVRSSCFFPHYIVCVHLLYKPISFIPIRPRYQTTLLNKNDFFSKLILTTKHSTKQ